MADDHAFQVTLLFAYLLDLLRYVEKNPGSFPKLSHVQKEIGGSWYTLKELLQNAKEKIFGNSKLQSDSINDVTSKSAADATASTVMTTQEKGSVKSDYNEASETLEDTLCHKSDIPPNSTPGTSVEILPDMIGDTASGTKRICNDLENTGPYKPRNLIQSSANIKSEDNSVSQAILNVKPEHCSEAALNATASEGLCDSRIPEAASDFSVGTVKVEGILNSPNLFQQETKRTQLEEQQNARDKPEKLSSLIYEATRTWQVKVKDKMASTGCRNQVENNFFADRGDKKIEEPPPAEPEDKHLELVEKLSTRLVSSNAETTTATMQNDVPTTFGSIRNELKQTWNQQKISAVSADKVSKGEGMPASGNGTQKFKRLSALFSNSKVDDQKAGQVMDKYNILESNGCFKNSDKNSRGNVPKPSDVNDLIDCIKEYFLGQVTSGPGTSMSNKNTDHLKVLSQMKMQKLDDGRQTSSSHTFNRKSEEPSAEAPLKIAYENGKTDNQEKGNAESVAPNSNIPPLRMRHLDKTQDRTCKESLDQHKVIVKFVHKDAGEQDLLSVLKPFDNNLKIELSAAGENRYKTATVYFKVSTHCYIIKIEC